VRVLLGWELGLNYGHLTRLLPIAKRLKADGHVVLVAVRDIETAARVFGPRDIPFVQAPYLPKGIPLDHRPTGYADILLSQGWSDRSSLWGLTQGWLNLYRLFQPDRLILDYSPTAGLAARIAGIRTLLIGNGFELPPLTDPLPPFPGFSWANFEKAQSSERLAVSNANAVLRAYHRPAMTALRDVLDVETRLFVTFPDLDHYGRRADAQYIGPLLDALPGTPITDWPEGSGPRIFVALRPDTSHLQLILGALAASPARVICVALGINKAFLAPFFKSHMRFGPQPVQLNNLLGADLCISYGAEGTIMKFLSAGVPQLIVPWHVEAFMAGRRIEAAGLGLTVESPPTVETILSRIDRLSSDATIHSNLDAFRARFAPYLDQRGVEVVLESLCLPVAPKTFAAPKVRVHPVHAQLQATASA
jgi:UDP:flavonoid glycosyltransferase YjiC (YdhE family)